MAELHELGNARYPAAPWSRTTGSPLIVGEAPQPVPSHTAELLVMLGALYGQLPRVAAEIQTRDLPLARQREFGDLLMQAGRVVRAHADMDDDAAQHISSLVVRDEVDHRGSNPGRS